MAYKIGTDVGGTFTDFLLADDDGNFEVYKTLTTPEDPSIGVLNGLKEMADAKKLPVVDFIRLVDIIVHGTTVTTNAALTGNGAKTGLLTTAGFRDTLQMRRGIREQQYNNKYEAPVPLVPRELRCPVKERVSVKGKRVKKLDRDSLLECLRMFKDEQIEALAVCFLHAYNNSINENEAKKIIQEYLPDVYLTLSSDLLPQIRFYDRLSTTTLNSYVGPILKNYIMQLMHRLNENEFRGILLIMQSNGGVTSPGNAIKNAVSTMLSGPSAGPVAGMAYAETHNYRDCITIDMGGTSFDVALVKDRKPLVITNGKINRYLTAVPMVDIHTIGAGGGSIGWLDEMGLLRIGPKSAGANPGPSCYGLGGTEPTCTDANLILGYINKDYFLGGKMALDYNHAYKVIEEKLAKPLRTSAAEASAGMFQIINANMADGIREVSVKKGYDPREFPLVVAGGAGPIHAGMIALELEIPTILIPRESSIFCATGMLLSDLRHDYVRSYNSLLTNKSLEPMEILFNKMKNEGEQQLLTEGIFHENIRHYFSTDMRYVGQYHEINVGISEEDLKNGRLKKISSRFHQTHDRLYGYSLKDENASMEIVNLRVSSLGITSKPGLQQRAFRAATGRNSVKSERKVYLPESKSFELIEVWDGDRLEDGIVINGPAIVEQVNTTIFVPAQYKLIPDRYSNFLMQLIT